jgi:hypothetical protein
MRGCRGSLIGRRKPECSPGFAAQRLAILAIASPWGRRLRDAHPPGPGYRVYFTRTGATIYFLLAGGDKSTQKRDVARAREMARELKET